MRIFAYLDGSYRSLFSLRFMNVAIGVFFCGVGPFFAQADPPVFTSPPPQATSGTVTDDGIPPDDALSISNVPVEVQDILNGPVPTSAPAADEEEEETVLPGQIPLPKRRQYLDPPSAVLIPSLSNQFLPLVYMAFPLSILRPEFPVGVSDIDAFRPLTPDPAGDTSSLESILAMPPDQQTELQPTTINGVICGKSTRTEVDQIWGKPKEIQDRSETIICAYDVQNVGRVEATYRIKDECMTTMVVRLSPIQSVLALTERLGLEKERSAPVTDPTGNVLGLVWPERGFSFGFQTPTTVEQVDMANVERIMIEPLSAELFLMRAEPNWYKTPEPTIRDLKWALKLDPQSAKAYWMMAQSHSLLGHPQAALACASEAMRLDPSSASYRLSVARFQLANNRWQDAIEDVEEVVKMKDIPTIVAARAEILMGDLCLMCVPMRFLEGIRSYTFAIQYLQEDLIQTTDPKRRIEARQLVLDAYLGGSYALALSDWLGRGEALSIWLVSGESIIQNYDGGDSVRFPFVLRALNVGAVSTENFVLDNHLSALEECSLRLLRNLTYSAYSRLHMRWEKTLAVYDAAWISWRQKEYKQALLATESVVGELSEIKKVDTDEAHQKLAEYLTGRMQFLQVMILRESGAPATAISMKMSQTIPLFIETQWLPVEEQFRLGADESWMAFLFWNLERKDAALATADHARSRLLHAEETAREADSVLIDLKLMSQTWERLEMLYRVAGRSQVADICQQKMQGFSALLPPSEAVPETQNVEGTAGEPPSTPNATMPQVAGAADETQSGKISPVLSGYGVGNSVSRGSTPQGEATPQGGRAIRGITPHGGTRPGIGF